MGIVIIEPITDNDDFWIEKFAVAQALWETSESLQSEYDTYFDFLKRHPSYRDSNEKDKIDELYNEWLLQVF